MRVIITELICEAGQKMLQEKAQVDLRLGIEREELLKTIKDYDAIIVRSGTLIDEEFMEKAENLKIVGRAGTGIDNIDVPAATRRGIIVANTPESNSTSAAEHAIALMMATSRNIPQANSFIKGGQWERSKFKGSELYGKTVGIIGLGRVGSRVATRLKGMGMRVISYDPYISEERFRRFGAEKIEKLEQLVKEADYITVHTPKTEETFGIIGEEQFAIAKKGVRVVNCARGGIINEEALYQAIKAGIVASAGIDVFVKEPSLGNPLFEFDNVIVTPHLGASTEEAQDRVGIMIASQVLSGLKGEIVPNALNMPTLIDDELIKLKPYLTLAEKMGRFYFQLEKESIERVELSYNGPISNEAVEMITISFLKGLLETVLRERVNYVNAPLLAKNRGIKVYENKKERTERGFINVIEAKIVNKYGEVVIAGTLYGEKEPRIIQLYDYGVDFPPTENMLIIENMDQPGMIGKMGMLLGEENVNIASMQVGRNYKGKLAMMSINIDNEVNNETLEKVAQSEGITSVKFVKL